MMAHSFWSLNELVETIAAILVSNHATASAVALAVCCKSFEEPALSQVWRCLSNLDPLVKCFPSEVWKIAANKELAFKRAPLLAEWTRFKQVYAPKVRRLTMVSYQDARIVSLATLHTFRLYSSCGVLLPNLVSLELDPGDDFLPFVSMFISRSLRSIMISLYESPSPMLPPILHRLSNIPDISEIRIRHLHHDEDVSFQVAASEFLMKCNPHFRQYNIDSPVSTTALSRLLQLPLLSRVFLLVDDSWFPDPLPPVVFPSLQSLDVEYTGDPTWLQLFPYIKSTVLTSIRVLTQMSDVENFMKTFQQTLVDCSMHRRLTEFQLRFTTDFAITSEVIARTAVFSNLTRLNISQLEHLSQWHCQTIELTDDDIDSLTRAMPRLEDLCIGETPCEVPSKITFKSLFNISRRCTRLTAVQIHFNPASFITQATSGDGQFDFFNNEVPSYEQSCVTEINVGDIRLSEEEKVLCIMAMGLRTLFPRLKKLSYTNWQWQLVARLIDVFGRM